MGRKEQSRLLSIWIGPLPLPLGSHLLLHYPSPPPRPFPPQVGSLLHSPFSLLPLAHLMEMLEMVHVTARILSARPNTTSGRAPVTCATPPGILDRLTTMLSATSSSSWHMAMWAAV